MAKRLPIPKTYKLAIGGQFPRGESGRVAPAPGAAGRAAARYCLASRKDLREAVVAARRAQAGWASRTPALRGQILYRAAELAEQRAGELAAELRRAGARNAASEVAASIDRLVYHAGWTDKFAQLFGAVNPVASPHFNFTFPEPAGVAALLCPDSPSLLGLVSLLAPAVLSGNSTVLVASETQPLAAITFAEILATSDFPPGVVNVLTGRRAELAPHLATHMEIDAIVDGSGDRTIARTLQSGSSTNLKRVIIRNLAPAGWRGAKAENPDWILDTVEWKTAWHPIGA